MWKARLFVCLFVCLFGLGFVWFTHTHTHLHPHALVFANSAASNRLRRPSPTSPYCYSLLSPIQNMCGISSLAFTTVAHRDFLYLRTAGIHFGPSPPSLVFAIPQ